MKVVGIGRLRNTDHALMRAGLETFAKSGVDGMEALWLSADGRTIIAVYEVDDPTELHKYNSLYAPYLEDTELHVVSDVAAGVAHIQAGLDMLG